MAANMFPPTEEHWATDLDGRRFRLQSLPPPSTVQSNPRDYPLPGPATPSHANAHPPPPNWVVSIVELATFFPDWRNVPEVAFRFRLNNWQPGSAAFIDMYSKGFLETGPYPRDEHIHVVKAWKEDLDRAFELAPAAQEGRRHGVSVNDVSYWLNQGMCSDLTVAHWTPPGGEWVHVKLADIYAHVREDRWPKGKDLRLVTKCLSFAAKNPHLDLDTSHWGWIIRALGITHAHREGRAFDLRGAKFWRRRVVAKAARDTFPDLRPAWGQYYVRLALMDGDVRHMREALQ